MSFRRLKTRVALAIDGSAVITITVLNLGLSTARLVINPRDDDVRLWSPETEFGKVVLGVAALPFVAAVYLLVRPRR